MKQPNRVLVLFFVITIAGAPLALRAEPKPTPGKTIDSKSAAKTKPPKHGRNSQETAKGGKVKPSSTSKHGAPLAAPIYSGSVQNGVTAGTEHQVNGSAQVGQTQPAKSTPGANNNPRPGNSGE